MRSRPCRRQSSRGSASPCRRERRTSCPSSARARAATAGCGWRFACPSSRTAPSAGCSAAPSPGPYETVDTHLVVDRERYRVTLYRRGRIVFSANAGVGTDAWPTPAGEFAVRSELTRYASPFYGPVAFGTTARSAVLTDWPEGGFVGIHGTDEPQLLPGRVSHGCIRLRDPDILRLARLMPVGTPLTIR